MESVAERHPGRSEFLQLEDLAAYLEQNPGRAHRLLAAFKESVR